MFSKIKSLIRILKANFFSDYNKWTKSWEKNPGYMEFMEKDYSLFDPSGIALKFVEKGNVLSAGCGPGREVKYLVSLGCKVTAIDHSENMIKESKKLEPKAKYILGDIVNYKSKNKFDYVVCLFNTINYLQDFYVRRKFVVNSYNNLKSGGKLIIVTKHRFSNFGSFIRSLLTNKNFYFSPKQIEKWFLGLGFRIRKARINDSILIIAEKVK